MQPNQATAPQPPNSPREKLDARVLARTRREAMRSRARRIRRSIAGGAAALFTAAFLAVYVQLASGHDPALSANAARRTTVAATLIASNTSSTSASASATAAAERAAAAKRVAAAKRAAASASVAAQASSAESSKPESPTTTAASAVTTSQS